MIIPKQTFPFYGILIVLSMLIGLLYVFIMLKKEKIDNKNVYLYAILYISFSLVFGKMFSMVATGFKQNILESGLSSYGGVIGVILACIIFELILPTNKKIIKYAILSLPLVYGIGKIGCFIAGCCSGIPYNGIFKVIYKDGLNIGQFPIQIVESITFIILFIIINKLRNKKNIIYITIFISIILKFLLDFLRYEHINKLLTTNQIFSIIVLISLIIIYVFRSKIKKTF